MRRCALLLTLLAGLFIPADAIARTTVTVTGTEIVIRVPIQLASMLEHQRMRNPITGERYDWAQLGEFIARESERFWNEGTTGADAFFGVTPSGGLSAVRYRDCFTIRIVVEVVITPFVQAGRKVKLDGYHYMVFDNKPTGKMVVWDPATPDPNVDTPSAYERSLTGEWTSWEDYFGGAGHELGHLLGLGDDYDHESGESLAGRDGTVMDKGREIDQAIVGRIVGLVEASGVTLPECWHGTWSEGNAAMTAGGTFSLTVDAEGRVEGKGTGTQEVAGGGSASYPLEISGRRTPGEFRLVFAGSGGSLEVVTPIDGATARGPWRTGAGQAAYRGTIELECRTCGDDPGG